jgi:hypothetical protein
VAGVELRGVHQQAQFGAAVLGEPRLT